MVGPLISDPQDCGQRSLFDTPPGRRLLFVASTGGHLAQLNRLAPRFGAHPESVWVTFDSPQSTSLLRGLNVVHVPYVGPREVRGIMMARRIIRQQLSNHGLQGVVSTGAGLALAGFTAGVAPQHGNRYIESVSRTEGPSATGRLIARSRLARIYTQHSSWAHGRWTAIPSVLQDYLLSTAGPKLERPSLFVTLGTIKPYRFDRLVDAILASGLADDRTVWQLGATTRTDLPGTIYEHMGMPHFMQAARQADLVVTHAGVGTILNLLDDGICPVVVPRLKRSGEHVDDHQLQICGLLADSKTATVLHPTEISADSLKRSTGFTMEVA